MRESALSFVIDLPGLASVPYCAENLQTRGLPPHLTVLYPWHPAPLGADSIARAVDSVRGTGPVRLVFDHVDTFASGVVYAALADPTPVVALTQRVATAFPETPPYGGAHEEPVPHLTLGRCRPDDMRRLADEVRLHAGALLPLEVHLEHLDVLEQDDAGRWSVTGSVSLR